jgi:hypothetical protein
VLLLDLLYHLMALVAVAACIVAWRAERRAAAIAAGGRQLIRKANEREANANTRANRAEVDAETQFNRAMIAENACEELRKQVMRGSSLMRITLRNPHPNADPVLDVAVIDGRGYAFTDSVLPRAASIYERAVANGQMDPLT